MASRGLCHASQGRNPPWGWGPGCGNGDSVTPDPSSVYYRLDALQHVATGHYEGEHWLASFAVFLLTETP